jgi:Lon protease-like protein
MMPMNMPYHGPGDLPDVIPVFPLPGALLLPRGQMPLNIFEPRYIAMVDDVFLSGRRLIGMIQPDILHSGDESRPHLFKIGCVGRITQFGETGDGRYLIELTGISRYRIEEELAVVTPYRQCRVTYEPFADDFVARRGEDSVDREALVNALAMMSPYGAAEKQAMLEAPDLKTRAEILVAITEIELAKGKTEGEPSLQ